MYPLSHPRPARSRAHVGRALLALLHASAGLAAAHAAQGGKAPPWLSTPVLVEHAGFSVRMPLPDREGKDCHPALLVHTRERRSFETDRRGVGEAIRLGFAAYLARCKTQEFMLIVNGGSDDFPHPFDGYRAAAYEAQGWQLVDQLSAAAPKLQNPVGSVDPRLVAAVAPAEPSERKAAAAARRKPAAFSGRFPSNREAGVDPRCDPLRPGGPSPSAREVCHAVQARFNAQEAAGAAEARRLQGAIGGVSGMLRNSPFADQILGMAMTGQWKERTIRRFSLGTCAHAGSDPKTGALVAACSYSVGLDLKVMRMDTSELAREEQESYDDLALFTYESGRWMRYAGVMSQVESARQARADRAEEDNRRTTAMMRAAEDARCSEQPVSPAQEAACQQRLQSKRLNSPPSSGADAELSFDAGRRQLQGSR